MAEAVLGDAGYRTAGSGSVRELCASKPKGTGFFRLIAMLFTKLPEQRIPVLNMHEFDEADRAIQGINEQVETFIARMKQHHDDAKSVSEILKNDQPLN